jgi:hypothetical protein
LRAYGALGGAVECRRGVHGERRATRVERAEEREPLHVVPVQVGEEEREVERWLAGPWRAVQGGPHELDA